MNRRGILLGACSLPAVLAGCTSENEIIEQDDQSQNTTASATDDGENSGDDDTSDTDEDSEPTEFGSEDQPRRVAEVTVEFDSASKIYDTTDLPIPLILSGDQFQTVFVDNEDLQTTEIVDRIEAAGFQAVSMAESDWHGELVHKVRTFARFPKDVTETELEEAFPNRVRLASSALIGQNDESWSLYIPLESRDVIRDRLGELGVDKRSTAILVYNSCERYDW